MIPTVATTDLPGVDVIHRGKVRDVYKIDQGRILLVSTDRLSAFDCVLPTPIPLKGRVLNTLSSFWFRQTRNVFPNHFITDDVDQFPEELRPFADLLRGRSSLVNECEREPVECVIRGYLSGSAWTEYQKSGTVQGHKLPAGLKESDKLAYPIFTPTTKADKGHDEPLTIEQLQKFVGKEKARALEDASRKLFVAATEYAATRGLIVADTKFEFGKLDGNLVVIDEMLTPDSTRFWDAATYAPGGPQKSFDKQAVRDFLAASGWNKQPPAPALPDEVVESTTRRYCDALEKLTGMRVP